MTITNADLIAEVLRRQAQIRDICEDGDPVNQEAYDRLRRQNADAAPELARRLREAEEKLARANEAAHAAGFAEGVETAAKVADAEATTMDVTADALPASEAWPYKKAAICLESAAELIRALTPAAKSTGSEQP